MTLSSNNALVFTDDGRYSKNEGTRRYRVPICAETGAETIQQTVNLYLPGEAPARRNPVGEEVLYVIDGSGACNINGRRYGLSPGIAVYIPPGSIYQISNTSDLDLRTIGVCCPEDPEAGIVVAPVAADPDDTAPFRTVREDHQVSIAAGDRTFKILVSQEIGCKRVTQFIGVIPPGRAPMHYHTYEEAIYILEGEGQVWTEGGCSPFSSGTSIYLPRGVRHSLENTGSCSVRLLGVFHPSGSPSAAYEDKVD